MSDQQPSQEPGHVQHPQDGQPAHGQDSPQPPAYEQPAYVQGPGYTQQPASTQQPGFTEQPAYNDQPAFGQQAYVQPPVYGQQPSYGQQPAYGMAQPTDGLSIAALVTGILGLGVVPIVLGILGLKRTKANGSKGRGFSIAGIVLGGLGVLVSIVLVAVVIIAGLAMDTSSDSISEALGTLPTAEQTEQATDDGLQLDDSATPLLDLVPLDVAGFTTAGYVIDDATLAAGALEAYTATFTDGTSTVSAVLADWPTEELGQAWAAAAGSSFTADQLLDSGEPDTGVAYTWYEVDGVATVVATNSTAALTFTGPSSAVEALYNEYPL